VDTEPFGATVSDHTIRVHGDIDMNAADQLVATVSCVADHGSGPTIVMDMASVTFLDSMGINALIHAHKRVESMGKELVIHNVPGKIQETLVLTGVQDYLNVRSVT
jgi:anti-anti-sigma factor